MELRRRAGHPPGSERTQTRRHVSELGCAAVSSDHGALEGQSVRHGSGPVFPGNLDRAVPSSEDVIGGVTAIVPGRGSSKIRPASNIQCGGLRCGGPR